MTSILTLEKRINAFEKLGEYLLHPDEELSNLIQSCQYTNPWFIPRETEKAVTAFGKILNAPALNKWLEEVTEPASSKKVGLILAGNIPMVGFHDILSVLASGHIAFIKLSSQDKTLVPHLLNKLAEFEPGFASQIEYTEQMKNFDAVVATGSNNSSRYFEYYFSKVPHIIRKNRNSAAVLFGNETTEDLENLGKDIFDFFGLGCRNVSKLFVPEGYSFNQFFEAIEKYSFVSEHYKYNNNYDYNKSIYLVNREEHLDNGFLLLKKDERFASPLAVIFHEEYKGKEALEKKLTEASELLQCMVSKTSLNIPSQIVDFGRSQQPELWDYADGVDTLKFLQSI